MPKLDLIYFDAGGGHRAAATALKQSFAEKYPDWEVRLMHLQEELSSMDLFRQLFVAEILCVPFRYFVMFKQRPKIHLIRNNSDKKCLH